MPPNGPAIKCVCVAEQVKAGPVSPLLGSVLSPAERSEAWRGFWRHVQTIGRIRVSVQS
jgi:hypothetical protein